MIRSIINWILQHAMQYESSQISLVLFGEYPCPLEENYE